MKKTFPLCIVLFLSCCAAISGAVDFSILTAGTHAAGITGRINEAFVDRPSYDAFRHMISAGTTPAPAAPAVDFSNDMVIAVSPGQMPTGGYSVDITGVADRGTKVVVTIVVTGPTGPVTMALTEPYQIIRIARTDLPIEYVWEERLSGQGP